MRGFHGRWIRGGGSSHTPSLAALISQPHQPSMHVAVPTRAMAARVDPSGVSRPRVSSVAAQRYEGGASPFVSGETRSKMLGMFTAAERGSSKPRQPTSSLNELYASVPEAQKRYEAVLRRVQARLGADERNFHNLDTSGASGRLDEALRDRTHQVHIIMGPTKRLERAKPKVDVKYEGDASRLTDVTRATVAVPHADGLPGVVEAVRKSLPKGWELRTPENRFVHVGGDKTHTGAIGGYRDISMLLVDPQGFVHELQINTTHMVAVKQGRGHAIYEELQALERKVGSRRYTQQEAALRRGLERESRELYDAAMVRSTGPAARLGPRLPLR